MHARAHASVCVCVCSCVLMCLCVHDVERYAFFPAPFCTWGTSTLHLHPARKQSWARHLLCVRVYMCVYICVWPYTCSKEELGQMSASLLEPPQYRTVVYGMQPSLAAQDIQVCVCVCVCE